MKKFLLRTAVFLITFFVVLIIAGQVLNKDHDNMTMEMPQGTLPTITMLCDGMEYNRLYGYVVSMDYAEMREELTILGADRNVDFLISPYGRQVTKIEAQLRSMDGERLIEVATLQGTPRGNDMQVSLTLKDLIEENTEYMLVIQVEMDEYKDVFFYTRVCWNGNSHLASDLRFVKDFHEKLYNKEEAKELVKYLESNAKLESNSSFHKVNIHSSFKQITWGDLGVTETVAPVFTLREMGAQICSLVADYEVATNEADVETRYRMREYFRIRYTADRTYLLDYEREMTQIPSDDGLYGGDKVLLGIGDENVEMMESESGAVLAFLQADCLYSYQGGSQKMTRIFRFDDNDVADVRNSHDEHDIKILNVDEEGNVAFAVYGYMNRGEHEGEVGVRICNYDANLNVVEEKLFLPWKKSYSNLQTQMKKLLYLSEDGKLYLRLDQAVYQVDVKTGTCTKLIEISWDGGMQVSEDHQILIWQRDRDTEYASEIHVHDLKTDEIHTISAKQGEKIKILGFMEQDIIYGVARVDQISRDQAGRLFFPVYRLCIAKTDGTVVKEYEQENTYVTDCSVEENQIVLERVELKENGSFVPTSQDHITRTQKLVAMKNSVSTVDIDVYERYIQIKVANKAQAKNLQMLTPKEVVHEGGRDIVINAASPGEYYRVYGPYGVEGLCVSAANAVNLAYDVAGTVVSGRGETVWKKGEWISRNQIMAIKDPKKAAKEESLAVCLDEMLSVYGITAESSVLLEEGKSTQEILGKVTTMSPVDLTGCPIDAMLYFISQDVPVLGIMQDGEAVLVTGYNESQVVVYQPTLGKLHKLSKKDADKWFSENGNCFFTFFK